MKHIESISFPTPNKECKVLVRCFTFNQATYIEDALNGFAIQQTNFPFACLIMDDASTDGEQEVLKAWMERECDMSKAEHIDITTSSVIIVPHKKNPSCTFAFYLLKQNLYRSENKMKHVYPWREKCIYEAICEGDDYWIDPCKLQKQVDILEKNKNISICFCNAKRLNCLTNSIEDFVSFPKTIYSAKDIFRGKWFIATASMMYRVDIFKQELPEWYKRNTIDVARQLLCGKYGDFYMLQESMVVYRFFSKNSLTKKNNQSIDLSIKSLKAYITLLKDSNRHHYNNKYSSYLLFTRTKNYLSLLKLYLKKYIL